MQKKDLRKQRRKDIEQWYIVEKRGDHRQHCGFFARVNLFFDRKKCRNIIDGGLLDQNRPEVEHDNLPYNRNKE